MTFIVDSWVFVPRRLYFTSFTRNKFSCISANRFHMDRSDEAKSTMEIINVPPLVSVYRHALHTFNDNQKKDLTTNLNKLKSMMDRLKQEHFNFDSTTLSNPDTWKRSNKAPCTYIEVFQNSQLNMSIFVLKPGFKMPLHDHPHMFGLLKVIMGAVNIRTFTEYPLKELDIPADFLEKAKQQAARLAHGKPKQRSFFAKVTSDRVCKEDSPTCLLTPTISNYHEIEALGVPAAFFDILSPPYDTFIEGIGPRRCRYYNALNISTNLVHLQETEVPTCFYCDQAPYLGPTLA